MSFYILLFKLHELRKIAETSAPTSSLSCLSSIFSAFELQSTLSWEFFPATISPQKHRRTQFWQTKAKYAEAVSLSKKKPVSILIFLKATLRRKRGISDRIYIDRKEKKISAYSQFFYLASALPKWLLYSSKRSKLLSNFPFPSISSSQWIWDPQRVPFEWIIQNGWLQVAPCFPENCIVWRSSKLLLYQG